MRVWFAGRICPRAQQPLTATCASQRLLVSFIKPLSIGSGVSPVLRPTQSKTLFGDVEQVLSLAVSFRSVTTMYCCRSLHQGRQSISSLKLRTEMRQRLFPRQPRHSLVRSLLGWGSQLQSTCELVNVVYDLILDDYLIALLLYRYACIVDSFPRSVNQVGIGFNNICMGVCTQC